MVKKILIFVFIGCAFLANCNKKFYKKLNGAWLEKNVVSAFNLHDDILLFGNDNYNEVNSKGEGRSFWHFFTPTQILIKDSTIKFESGELEFNFDILEIEYNKKEKKFLIIAKSIGYCQVSCVNLFSIGRLFLPNGADLHVSSIFKATKHSSL